MERFRVLITDRFDVSALAALRTSGAIEVSQSREPHPSSEELASADALIIRSRTKIDAGLLSKAPRLKVVVTATSGYDHIDFEATAKAGTIVMHTPEANAASACELTWGLILACSRRLIDAHRAVKDGEWKREALLGRELSGKTLGTVGLGRIGSRVARVAQAFGMKVVAFDPYKEAEHFESSCAARVSFDELLKLSDVVTFHVPATFETRDMLGRTHLEEMNRGAILINTSRGAVVSERNLVEALQKGWLAACGLDVFEREPLPRHSELIALPNVVLSPHIGATTGEAFAAASLAAAEKIIAFVRDGRTSDLLPHSDYVGHRADKA